MQYMEILLRAANVFINNSIVKCNTAKRFFLMSYCKFYMQVSSVMLIKALNLR